MISEEGTVEAPIGVNVDGGLGPAKLSGLHDWLSMENRKVKSWWASRTGTDIHKLYLTQLHDADELRSQLNEQLRALDYRVDTQTALVAELQDWFRKRAELHQDYSVKLDKLAKSLHARHKEQKVKREQWNLFSVYNCWQILVNQTKKDARDHSAMADVYLNNIVPRFTQVQEDVQRIYKKCREIGYESHEELLKVLHELHTTMRTYHMYQAEFKSAEAKLQNLEAQKHKLEATNPKEKLEKRKKYKVIEKEIEKRKCKYKDAKLKALKARNEYILSMDSANSSIHKYFVEDLSDIVDCMDFGFHSSMAKALLTHINGQECFKRTLQNGIDDLNKSINNLDSRHDKQRFLEFNNTAFMLPKKFEFQGHKGDEMSQVLVTHPIQEEMEKRYAHLVSRLTNLKTESEEAWKTIETAEKTLLDMINTRDYDIAHYFAEEPRVETKQPESVIVKRKADRQETEEFYLGKFRDYTVGSNLICRLQARYELMRKALGDENQTNSSPTPTRNLALKPRRRRIGRTPLMGQPRLFGGSLEEYLEATSQEIPLIMKSCIRVINLYGLHHQGIFRVSGSQVEINNFRESFERMEDPLADVSDASDINSIAGVLKLYLRELREPIFPTVYFEQFMEIAQLESKQEFVTKVREVIMSLPRAVFVVMRYLFAFLNHLSEFSDENMMDPYNLAICFGPTLVPIPEDKDQVQYQNLVNELIKNIIIFFEDIFPNDGGPIYEKFISRDSLDLDADMGEAPVEDADTVDSEPGQSEDESEILEAVAQFDFTARSPRELSFNKRDIILLHSQVSSDWWKGSFKGKVGLIPDKYILLKIRDEDKDRVSDRGSTCEDPPKRRASSSSESNVIGSSHLSDNSESINGGESPGIPTIDQSIQDQSTSPFLYEKRIGRMCSSPVPSLTSLSSSCGGGGFDGGGAGSSPSEGATSETPGSNSPNLSGVVPHPPEEMTILAHRCETPKIGCNFGRELKAKLSYSSVDSLTSILPSPSISTDKTSRSSLSDKNRMHTSFSEPHHSESLNAFSSTWGRPASQSSLSSSSSDEKLSLSSQSAMWDTCKQSKASSGAPDLVMDLPITSLSSSPKEQGTSETSPRLHASYRREMQESDTRIGCASSNAKSPDMVTMTAAECFAKQNQSTLKKVPMVNKLAVAAISTDAQTQTSATVKVSTSISTDYPQMTEKDSPCKDETETPSGSIAIKTMAVMLPTAQDDLVIEVRAAADMISSDIAGTPSTPKLAARYLKAVAASGGGTGVAVKPQVKVKPTVMRKPSNLPLASDCDTPKVPP